MLTNSTFTAEAEVPMEVKSCTVGELRDMLQEIQVLAEKLSISLSSERHYNHKMFFTLTDTMPDGVMVTDGEGNIRVTSANALDMMFVGAEGLNGRHILECFPTIGTYCDQGSKIWTDADFVFDSKVVRLEVLVSKIELSETLAESPGANCIILLRSPIGQCCAPSTTPEEKQVVDKYMITSNADGEIARCSPNLLKLLQDRPKSLVHLRNLVGAKLLSAFSSSNLDLQNVDVSYVTVEAGDLDIRSMIAYKTNIIAEGGTGILGYSLTLLDVSADVPQPRYPGPASLHVQSVQLSSQPSALVLLHGWKPLYCNNALYDHFGFFAPDLLDRCLFSTLLSSIKNAEDITEYMSAAIFAGLEWNGTVSLLTANGRCAQYAVTVKPLPSDLGHFIFKELP